ncbi:MAG: YvcK family protein, partial [Erysipelotrichaceae bacterium]|nr:YvcK family protein [Erysipelotrichaceae bacterium]
IDAINNADLIVYGIGSPYTSILPNTIIADINEALNNSKAEKIYFANCMTQSNETYNYDLKAHIDAFRKHNTKVDRVIMHVDSIPEDIRERYKRQNSIEVIDNGDSGIEVLKMPLLKFDHSLVRHDPALVREAVKELL